MEPGEALSTAAQIAVALAGFAGVVVVFRRESIHDWSPIDKVRLRLLLTNSILPLALCMFGAAIADDQARPDYHLEVVQRMCICDLRVLRNNDGEDFSALGCATVTK
jgi:hypothetical protein